MKLTDPYSKKPLFVVGVPKSGTTLVANLIKNHPDFEIDFDNEAINQFMWYVQKTMDNVFFLKAANNVPPLEKQIVYWQDNDFHHFHELNKTYFTYLHLGWDSGRRWGSTNNLMCFYYEIIWKWYPEAEWVLLQRDPRDNWASFRHHKHPYSENGEIDHWELFVSRYNRVHRIREALRNDPRVHLIQYHEVVNDPELVYRLLGISIPENYLESGKEVLFDRSYGLSLDEIKEALTGNPIVTSRVGRWKRDLSKDEIDRCEKAFPEICNYYDEVCP
jgi:hypothetical protein